MMELSEISQREKDKYQMIPLMECQETAKEDTKLIQNKF